MTDLSNTQKYATKNPVVRALIGRFYGRIAELLQTGYTDRQSFLDAGCGFGEALHRLDALLPSTVAGFDLEPVAVEQARARLPERITLSVADVCQSQLPDDSYDTVLCLEVLEHLPDPTLALHELRRIARHELILSVPHEPWFQLGSLARGKYLRTLGNHPEHVNHWNPRRFAAFLEPHLRVQRVTTAFPWILARCAPA